MHRISSAGFLRLVEDEFAFEERLKREAYAMAALAHPNIVQVYDCGDAGEHHLFISMELVEGGDMMLLGATRFWAA
jgi:serine/threonine protein kinase